MRSIPVVDYADFLSQDENRKTKFTQAVGDSLKDIGFFALKNHGIPLEAIEDSYRQGDEFFSLSDEVKRSYLQPKIAHQEATLLLALNTQRTIQHQTSKNSGKPVAATLPVAKLRPMFQMCGLTNMYLGSNLLSTDCMDRWSNCLKTYFNLAAFILTNQWTGWARWQKMATQSCASSTIHHLATMYPKAQFDLQPMRTSISSHCW